MNNNYTLLHKTGFRNNMIYFQNGLVQISLSTIGCGQMVKWSHVLNIIFMVRRSTLQNIVSMIYIFDLWVGTNAQSFQ